MTVRQNTYARARLQGDRVGLATRIPVASPLQRCILLYLAMNEGDDCPASVDYSLLAAFCGSPEGAVRMQLSHMVGVGLLQYHPDATFWFDDRSMRWEANV